MTSTDWARAADAQENLARACLEDVITGNDKHGTERRAFVSANQHKRFYRKRAVQNAN